jgi:hypothetical protein
MALPIPALPGDSHVQSHAAVHKNINCVISLLPRSENDCKWLDSTPERTAVNGGHRAP